MPALPLPPCADGESEPPISLPLREFAFASARVVVQETSYAEGGLGWRVWSSARRLCCQLTAEPSLVEGRTVLELGAGVGLCGLLAARMGAAEVTLTDALPGLLAQLSVNAALNAELSSGVVRVRRFLWESDGDAPLPGAAKQDIVDPSSLLACQLRRLAAPSANAAAQLESGSTFDLLLASDCLYDWGQRRPLPRVLSRRLAKPHGVALLTVPVRDKTLLDAFVRELSREGLAWSCSPAMPADDAEAAGGSGSDGGTVAQRSESMEGEVEPLPHVDIRAWWPSPPTL